MYCVTGRKDVHPPFKFSGCGPVPVLACINNDDDVDDDDDVIVYPHIIHHQGGA